MLTETKELQDLIAATDRQLGRIEKMYEYHDRKCKCGAEVPAGSNICGDCLTKLMTFAPEPKFRKKKYYSDVIEGDGECPF